MNGKSTNSLKYIFDFVRESKFIHGAYPVIRVLIAISSLITAHVLGYADRLGIGVEAFVGFEVAGDLFADFISNVLFAGIFTSIVAIPALLLSNQKGGEVQGDFLIALKSKILFVILFVIIFIYLYLNLRYTSLSRALDYGIQSVYLVEASILVAIGSFIICKTKGLKYPFTSLLMLVLFPTFYYAGEVKAGTVPKNKLMQVVFSNGTKLDGYPLHRVSNGIIFKKHNFFEFDVGTVFIPYSSVIMITEPSVYSGGAAPALANDYPRMIPEKKNLAIKKVPSKELSNEANKFIESK
jgi:hypothetical protein